jgi:ATPase subunit of ABC transporter with duplicated ATPase domains
MDYSATVLDDLVGPGVSQKEVRTMLGSLLISEEKISQKIETLS